MNERSEKSPGSLLDMLLDDDDGPLMKVQAIIHPVLESQWAFSGYLARVALTPCPACPTVQALTLGVFAEELGPQGSRRLTRASEFPRKKGQRMEMEHRSPMLCPVCLHGLGFDSSVDAPLAPDIRLAAVKGEGIGRFPGVRRKEVVK